MTTSTDASRAYETPGHAELPRRRSNDDTRGREIFRLRALNCLAEHLNMSADVRTLVEGSLDIVRDVLGAKAAWAYLWNKDGLHIPAHECEDNEHDFALVGCRGLPGGRMDGSCRHLCRPPDCACQQLLRRGALDKGVNIVSCTRLDDIEEADSDSRRPLLHATVPLISRSGRLGILNIATESWDKMPDQDLQLLTAAGLQIAAAIERARGYEVAEDQRARLADELEMARSVQRALFPPELPAIRCFDIAAEWNSAREMAGDFYDLIELPDGRWAVVVADVSGKGAPAAMYMAMIRSIIRTEVSRDSSPSVVLGELNRRLRTDTTASMFVTVFFGILDPNEVTLTYCNAGHDPPLLRRPGGRIERLPFGGLILGIFDEVELHCSTMALESGTSLLIYTDGLTDAVNRNDEDYGLNRLNKSFGAGPAGAKDMVSHLRRDLSLFTKGTPPIDDITLLVVNRK
jgi:serine phosphatase RsbU (regulator of sigma subunit)